MAVYKVPQDVEAEDKLIGPFGFRQFIYLLIAAGAGGLTFLFFQVPPPVPFFSILTVPVILVFVVLALPLRKDQPMEIYIAAVLRFMFKPKKRLWLNDGTAAGVIIDIPKTVARQFAKDITQEEALDKLAYLSRIVDTRGWAAKGVDTAVGGTLIQTPDPYASEDVLDESSGLARSFDSMLAKQKQTSQGNIEQILHPAQQPAPQQPTAPQPTIAPAATVEREMPAPLPAGDPWARYDSRPTESQEPAPHPRGGHTPQQLASRLDRMRGHTFHAPTSQTPSESTAPTQEAAPQTQVAAPEPPLPPTNSAQPEPNKDVTPQVSADKMRLAYNNDLSIQTIANEAHRIDDASKGNEVEIKLR